MSCVISAFIVHQMTKDESKNRLEPHYGSSILEVNESIQALMDKLNGKYITQGGRTFGEFSTDDDNYPVSRYLTEANLVNSVDNFYELSKKILDHLVVKARATSATGGWVVICVYEQNHQKILSIAVVNEITGATVDESFRIKPSLYIDLNKLRHAGRVNLTKWNANGKSYVNFIKAQHESSYFKQFLGCESTNSNLEESKKVITAIRAYCDLKEFDYVKRKQITDLAFRWLDDAAKAKTPIYLAHLANHLASDNAEELTKFLVSDEYGINDHFVPHRTALKSLVEIRASEDYWEVKLTNDAFEHGAIYDIENKRLILPVKNTEDQEQLAKRVQGLEDHDSD